MERITDRHRNAPVKGDTNGYGCGAEGPIAYRDGKPWSVNGSDGIVTDWRYELYNEARCSECARLKGTSI